MLIAVYGTLKKEYWNHRVMVQAKWKFKDEDFVQVEKLKDVGFPCVKFSDKSKLWLNVELYEVDEDMIKHLDRLEWYTPWSEYNHYNRIKVTTRAGKEVYVYEYNSHISDKDNNLNAHYVIETPIGRFHNWKRKTY